LALAVSAAVAAEYCLASFRRFLNVGGFLDQACNGDFARNDAEVLWISATRFTTLSFAFRRVAFPRFSAYPART
jgi:hypothetical protein